MAIIAGEVGYTLTEWVTVLLNRHFSGATIDWRSFENGERFSGFLIWEGFQGESQTERQQRVRAVLDRALSVDERRRLLSIFTVTPQEWQQMREHHPITDAQLPSDLLDKAKKVLRKAFPKAQIRLYTTPNGKKVWGFVIWDGFEGIAHQDRIQKVNGRLEHELPEQFDFFSAIYANTSQEFDRSQEKYQ